VGVDSNRYLFRQHVVARPLCQTPGLIVADNLIDALARAARWSLDLLVTAEIFVGSAEPKSKSYEYLVILNVSSYTLRTTNIQRTFIVLTPLHAPARIAA
jgi:hypothetical protein